MHCSTSLTHWMLARAAYAHSPGLGSDRFKHRGTPSQSLPRLVARVTLLASLLHLSGWTTRVPLSPAAMCLVAYLGVVCMSGVVGIDDKWILVCSPSAVHPHGRRSRAVWRYAYFAINVYSYDILALEPYPSTMMKRCA